VTQVHVVMSGKGGVGKTTLTLQLAATTHDVLSGDPGQSPVLVVSLDPQASAVFWGEQVGEKLPFDFDQAEDSPEFISSLRSFTQYEHIFIDTAGSLENVDRVRRILDQADDVIVPIPPEILAFPATRETIADFILPKDLPYVVVICNWDPRDGTADLNETRDFITNNGWNLAKTVIRKYKLHARAAAEGTVVTQFPRNKVGLEARSDFLNLALELGIGGSVGPRTRKEAR